MKNEDYEKLLKAMSELLEDDPDTTEPTSTHRLTVIDITYDE
jgi:hypothetical protein